MMKGWKKSTLGEACAIEKGKASAANEPHGFYPLVTTGAERKSAADWQFEGPAVCVPMISAYGHGKPGLKYIHYQEGKFALANILSALFIRNSEELSTKFLATFLDFYKDHLIVPLQFGAANMGITVERLATVPIWYPSLIEQERILSLLNENDSLRKLRGQTSARMEEFVPALFHEMFGDPITNPKKWHTRKISELCNLVRGSSPRPKSDPKYYGGPIPRLMIEDITRDGWLVIPKVDSLTVEGAKLSRPVPAGTVVMAVSANIGLMAKLAVDACIHDGFVAFKNLDENIVNTDYFVFCLTYLREESKRYMAGAIFQNLTVAQVNGLSLPTPPLDIQHEFAQRVQEAREIQFRQSQSAQRIEALYQSMLSRAFAGEL